MDVICDINVATAIVGWLNANGLEAIFATDLMGTDRDPDLKIAREADRLDALVITKDKTFAHVIRGVQVPAKILVLDDHNTRKRELIAGLTPHLPSIKSAATAVRVGCYLEYYRDGTFTTSD